MSVASYRPAFGKRPASAAAGKYTFALLQSATTTWTLNRWTGPITPDSREQFTIPIAGNAAVMAVDRNTGRIVVLGTTAANCVYSDDYGETWTPCEMRGSWSGVYFMQTRAQLRWSPDYGFFFMSGVNTSSARAGYSLDGARWNQVVRPTAAVFCDYTKTGYIVSVAYQAAQVYAGLASELRTAWLADLSTAIDNPFGSQSISGAAGGAIIHNEANNGATVFREAATSPGRWRSTTPTGAYSPITGGGASMAAINAMEYSALLDRHVLARSAAATNAVLYLVPDNDQPSNIQVIPNTTGHERLSYCVCDQLEEGKLLSGSNGMIYIGTPTTIDGVISLTFEPYDVTGSFVRSIVSDIQP